MWQTVKINSLVTLLLCVSRYVCKLNVAVIEYAVNGNLSFPLELVDCNKSWWMCITIYKGKILCKRNEIIKHGIKNVETRI